MSLSITFLLTYLIILSTFIFSNSQIILNCPSILSPIDMASFSPTYLNLFMQFVPSLKQNISTLITVSSNLITFDNGDFGKIIINGNSDLQYKENKLIYTYSSTRMQISFPSLNKYWGNFTDFEMIFTFKLENKFSNTAFPLLDNLMQNTIKLTFPILNLSGTNLTSISNILMNISMLLSNQNYTFINTFYTFPNIDLEKQITENDFQNYYKNFYFYVGNDAYHCETNILWIIMNNFIFLPDPYSTMLRTFFIKNNIDNTEILKRYYSRYLFPNNITVYKNFHINSVSSNLDKIILNSDSNSARFKVLKKVLFMIIIILI